MLNSLPISGPVVEARPDKFNFGRLCGGGGDGSSGYIGLEASKLVLRQCAESRSDMSLLGGTRETKKLTINNHSNSKLADSGDTGPLLETSFLKEAGSGICGAAMAGGERFCMSSMDECNTASQTCSTILEEDLNVGKGGS